MLEELIERVKNNLNISLCFDEKAIDKITELGYDSSYGARPLRRAIQSNIEDIFAEKYLEKDFQSGDKLNICYDEEFKFNKI